MHGSLTSLELLSWALARPRAIFHCSIAEQSEGTSELERVPKEGGGQRERDSVCVCV